MRPRRYPYSGKEEFKRLSYEAIHDTSQVTQ
ncbi:Uncharacterised protein [Streptococcus pneumoniae]|nr:Uncharacterised protein [Streptococcus pneumoniae]